MSGYLGNPDAEAEHALILSENGIAAARAAMQGPVLRDCADCGDPIAELRVNLAIADGRTCMYCITCQVHHDRHQRVKMLDRIL